MNAENLQGDLSIFITALITKINKSFRLCMSKKIHFVKLHTGLDMPNIKEWEVIWHLFYLLRYKVYC